MASKLLYFGVVCVLLGYYLYIPIPDNVEEPWKVLFIHATIGTLGRLAELTDVLGLNYYMSIVSVFMSSRNVPPISDENVTVTDTAFDNVPVRLFVAKKSSNTPRRALLYFHGGGWCAGSPAMKPYDLLARWAADRLNAVVVSVDYRLAPAHHFPIPFKDVYTVSKYFLQEEVLEQYYVDPKRVGISGDSAGGNLAAAVTQQLQEDPEVVVKPKLQALIYPALQTIDLDTPSYRDNHNMFILTRRNMARFFSEYFATDRSLFEAMRYNTHVTSDSNHLIRFSNWSNLLPAKLKKDHVYRSPQNGKSKFLKKYPGIIDPRAAPLLVENYRLSKLPLTYIMTCMYDVLRDDGFMYVSRLREAGVEVIHDHYNSAFHGMLHLIIWPTDLNLAYKMMNNYLKWLDENL